MIVAAFDLATATGVCDGAVASRPRLWTWHMSDAGDYRPARFAQLHRFLLAYFEQNPCDRVVYEAPQPMQVMSRINTSESAVAFLRGAAAVLEMTCWECSKSVEAIRVQDARWTVLGWRTNRFSKTKVATKDRVMRDVTKTLKIPAENDNEADAYVLWAHACARLNPRLASEMTPMFRDRS
jgi:hypothetical protein